MYSEQNLTEMIVPFYLGEKPDSKGRTIQQIWTWNFEDLECVHDYIQWLFPISEKSYFNPNAPVLDEKVIQTFQKDCELQANLLKSFTVMLHFYGLHLINLQGKVGVEKSDNYLERKQEWINLLNHNYLRITRILKCLIALGLSREAQTFYKCLSQIHRENSDQIGAETYQYWTNAVN